MMKTKRKRKPQSLAVAEMKIEEKQALLTDYSKTIVRTWWINGHASRDNQLEITLAEKVEGRR